MFDLVVLGGGAAGFFGAIAAAERGAQVLLLEKSAKVLSKVRVSGGGRCNVTHSCFDVPRLLQNYPRGNKELRGPFSRFQPKDTIEWFESRGVSLKTESDGRMFPITDSSETIIHCLQSEADRSGVTVRLRSPVSSFTPFDQGWKILVNEEAILAKNVLVSTGSQPDMWQRLSDLGHSIVPPVPSLFTFNIPDSPLVDLAGVSVPEAEVSLPEWNLKQKGPLLITHWGFSGPAVIKLSAWAARELHAKNYQTLVVINWLSQFSKGHCKEILQKTKEKDGNKLMASHCPFEVPKSLWKRWVHSDELRWAHASNEQIENLLKLVCESTFSMSGRTTYKEEFVTCGGVHLNEVNFKTMESKIRKGLFFAGEVLDIDGVTGGFNFQNAWTTSWIAGNSVAF